MVVLGVAFFVGLFGAMANLRLSIDEPYQELHFADFTVAFDSAPRSVVDGIANISGVDSVAGRLTLEVPATFPGRSSDVIAARIVSLPAPTHASVDDVLVDRGSYLATGAAPDVLAEKAFATHHGLQIGDDVRITAANGTWNGTVGGIAISPEYLWPARTAAEHMPDVLERWGVLFMGYDGLAALTGRTGTINEVAVTVKAGSDTDAVMQATRAALAAYHVTAVVPRAEQPSVVILNTTVSALDTLSFVFPVFFLVIVALSTYSLLTRLVHAQRAQIGVLLALGVSRRRVLAHYLEFALLVGLLGSLAGIVAGTLLSFPVTDLFASQVSLPLVVQAPHWDVMAAGIGLSLAFTALAGLLPALRASKEQPSETMRGEVPRDRPRHARFPRARPGKGKVSRKLPVRNLRRSPLRSALVVLALALAASLIIVPFGFLDSMDAAVRTQAESANFDLRALLYRPMPENTSRQVASWSGVAAAEGFVAASALLEMEGLSWNVALYGLRTDSDVYRLFDRAGNRVYASGDGILLSAIFERRGLQVGDSVNVSGLVTRVAGFTRDLTSNGYLPLGTVQADLGISGLVNGLFVRLTSPSSEDAVRAQLYGSLPVWAIASTARSIQETNDMMRLYYGFIGVIIVFGMALAAAIVFNAVTIGVLERTREIATMRTIGIRGRTIAGFITVENVLILAMSLVLGSLLGAVLTQYLAGLFGGDVFVLDADIGWRTYAVAAILLLAVLLVSELPSLRHVQRLDLAKATKERAG